MNIVAGIDCSNYCKLQNDYRTSLTEVEFIYGDASFSRFSMSTEGWMGRKVTALPLAAAAIVKAVYHLSMSLFEGLKGFCYQDVHAKMYAFCVVRDLEEFLGRLMTLFSDRVGGYLVEESAYQKTCYFLASNKIEGFSSSELQPYLKILSPKALGRISGPQLQGLDLSGFSFTEFQSSDFIYIFPRESNGSFTKETKARFAHLSAAQIQGILSELGRADSLQLITGEQLQGLDLTASHEYLQFIFRCDSSGRLSEETKARFSYLSKVQVQSILSSLITLHLLELISEEQLSGLDLSLLKEGDFNRMFTRGRSSGPKFTEDGQLFFSRLTAKLVQPILAKLEEHGLLELISREQLQGLDLSSLDEGDLGALFPRDEHGQLTEETKLRFSYLSAEQIAPVLDKLRYLGLVK